MKFRIPFMLAMIGLASAGFAQDHAEYLDKEDEEEYRLAIIDSDTSIEVLSRRPESARQAMGVISIINRREIELFGANNLYEVIDRVVSTYSLGTLLFSTNQISMRGDVNGNFSNRIAILLNGRPTWGSATEGVNFALLLGMPLEVVERLEIHRGPGSIYHGSAAFIGAINIVTKRPWQTHEATASVSAGSFGNYEASIAGGASNIGNKQNPSRGERISFYGGARYQNEDGFDANLYIPEPFGPAELNYKVNTAATSAFAELDYRGLRINALYAESTVTSLSETIDNSLIADDMVGEKLFLNAGYYYRFSDTWHLNLNASYIRDRASISEAALVFGDDTVDSYEIIDNDDSLLEGSINGNLLPSLKFTLGAEARYSSGGNSRFSYLRPYEGWQVRGYMDARYTLLKYVHLFGGLQLQQFDTLDTQVLTPKAGLMVDILPSVSLKVLYGYATRQPSQIESGLIFSENDLRVERPERIRTFETQLSALYKDISFSATYFYSRYIDQIISRRERTYLLGWTNDDNDMTTLGFEIEAQYAARPNLYITGSYAYVENRKLTDDPNLIEIGVTHAPTYFFKAGVAWFEPGVFSIGLHSSYYSTPTEVQLDTTIDSRNDLPGEYVWTTLSADWHLSSNLKLRLYITNLADEQVRWPDIANEQARSIPGRGGRAAYISAIFSLGDFY